MSLLGHDTNISGTEVNLSSNILCHGRRQCQGLPSLPPSSLETQESRSLTWPILLLILAPKYFSNPSISLYQLCHPWWAKSLSPAFRATTIDASSLLISVLIPLRLIPWTVEKGIFQNKTEIRQWHALKKNHPLPWISIFYKASDSYALKPLCSASISRSSFGPHSHLPSSGGSPVSSLNTSCSFPSQKPQRCSVFCLFLPLILSLTPSAYLTLPSRCAHILSQTSLVSSLDIPIRPSFCVTYCNQTLNIFIYFVFPGDVPPGKVFVLFSVIFLTHRMSPINSCSVSEQIGIWLDSYGHTFDHVNGHS